ncbi:polyprenyl synthetase family protein [Nocardia wallacei]|nr:polyprenyl synthetase family protein [Nocardia wallacei]
MTARRTPPTTHPVASHLERTTAVLTTFLREQFAHLGDIVGDDRIWSSVVADIERFTVGGKHLRPEFCYWGWRAGGGTDGDRVVQVSAALELLHAFALVHDDIIDHSDIRRGLPTMHRHCAELHRRYGLRGHSAAFGEAVAILVGDLCLGWFRDMLDAGVFGLAQGRDVRRLASRTIAELVGGEYLDLAEQSAQHPSIARSSKVIVYKTSRYTIERPMQLGATLAGGDPVVVNSFSRYALPLGEAFQLRDDLLGAFGDPRLTGKPDGDDLRAGKGTVLMATTRELADDVARRAIDAHLRRETVTEEDVACLREIMVATGAVKAIEERIGRQMRAAVRAADEIPTDTVVREALRDLASRTAYRNH